MYHVSLIQTSHKLACNINRWQALASEKHKTLQLRMESISCKSRFENHLQWVQDMYNTEKNKQYVTIRRLKRDIHNCNQAGYRKNQVLAFEQMKNEQLQLELSRRTKHFKNTLHKEQTIKDVAIGTLKHDIKQLNDDLNQSTSRYNEVLQKNKKLTQKLAHSCMAYFFLT